MIIELHGGQFRNQGAHKMLLCTINELGERIPNARFVADACVGSSEDLSGAGMETLLGSRGWMGGRFYALRFSAQRILAHAPSIMLRGNQNRVSLAACDALIDLAGFAYTDQWGAKPIADFSRLASYYSQREKPVILLPQALGPFEDPATQSAFSRIAASADLIYARDNISLRYATVAASAKANIRLCPDMTLPVGVKFGKPTIEKPIIIVPNMRVVDRGGAAPDAYLNILHRTIMAVGELGAVKILIHDLGGDDEKLARRLQRRLGKPVEIITVDDPWALKGEIAQASLLVGSRYHALVAALSCGVPTLAVGWSHKYSELMDEFECGDCLFAADSDGLALSQRALFLLDEANNHDQRDRLRKIAQEKKLMVSKMWDDVADILQRRVARSEGNAPHRALKSSSD